MLIFSFRKTSAEKGMSFSFKSHEKFIFPGCPRGYETSRREEIYPAPKFGVYLNIQLWTVLISANDT